MRREPLVSREELIKEGLSFLNRVDAAEFFVHWNENKKIIFISFEIGNRFSGTDMLISMSRTSSLNLLQHISYQLR